MAGLDDPIIGIKEDFRSPQRKHREREEFWIEIEEQRKAVEDGTLSCTRCDRPFARQDGQFSVSYILSHIPDGTCGKVPFCRECSFEVLGGWDGVYPEDADSWGLDEGCDVCQPILAEEGKRVDKASQRRTLLMPESYGSRLIQEPEQRPQQYVVGDRSVRRDELQSILMMFKYILVTVVPPTSEAKMMLREVDRIEKAVQHANNIRDWDWLEGMGESYVSEEDAPYDSKGDKFLCPKRWWPDLPPCPLTFI